MKDFQHNGPERSQRRQQKPRAAAAWTFRTKGSVGGLAKHSRLGPLQTFSSVSPVWGPRTGVTIELPDASAAAGLVHTESSRGLRSNQLRLERQRLVFWERRFLRR